MSDYNPLNADRSVVRAAGFEGLILLDLASYGLAARVLLHQCAEYDPARLGALDIRSASPVYPGEALTIDIWRVPGQPMQFQMCAKVRECDKLSLSHGFAERLVQTCCPGTTW